MDESQKQYTKEARHLLYDPIYMKFLKKKKKKAKLHIQKADQWLPSGGWEQGLNLNGHEKSFQDDGIVLKLDYGNGCVTVNVKLKL